MLHLSLRALQPSQLGPVAELPERPGMGPSVSEPITVSCRVRLELGGVISDGDDV